MSKEQGLREAWVRLAASDAGCRHPGMGHSIHSSEAT
jgi:hypothetical protein